MTDFFGKKVFVSLLVVMLVFSFSALVFASESGEGGGHFDLAKEIYKWINFLILAGALFFVLKKIIPEFFSSRVENIKKTLDESQEAEKKASVKLKAAEEKISNLSKEIETIKANTKASMEKEKVRIISEAKEKVSRIAEQNEQNIRQEYELAVNALKKEMIIKATILAEDIVKGRITGDERKKLFNKYLDNLGDIK